MKQTKLWSGWKKIKDVSAEVKRRQLLRADAASGRRIQQRFEVCFVFIPIGLALYVCRLPAFQNPDKHFGVLLGVAIFPAIVGVTQFLAAIFSKLGKFVAAKLSRRANIYESLRLNEQESWKFYCTHALNSIGTFLVIFIILIIASFADKNTPWGIHSLTEDPRILPIADVLMILALVALPALGWELTSLVKVRIGLRRNKGTFWS